MPLLPPESPFWGQKPQRIQHKEAAVKLRGEDIQLIPRAAFEALYTSIADGVADYILAPIGFNLAGSVHRSYDLLISGGLHIQAEVVISDCAQPHRRSRRDV